MLDTVKMSGGPFTYADEIESFLQQPMDPKEKQKHMKMKLKFARDISTLLPKVDPLFKIKVTLPSGKRMDKTSEEFSEALQFFLGKKADQSTIEYEKFSATLQKLLPA